jgi:hypothetical protein
MLRSFTFLLAMVVATDAAYALPTGPSFGPVAQSEPLGILDPPEAVNVPVRYDAARKKYCATFPTRTGSHISQVICQSRYDWVRAGYEFHGI